MTGVCFPSPLAGAIALKGYVLKDSKFSLAILWLFCFPEKAFMSYELRQQHMTTQVKNKKKRLLSYPSPLQVNTPASATLNPTTSYPEHRKGTPCIYLNDEKKHILSFGEEELQKGYPSSWTMNHKAKGLKGGM